MPKVFNPVVNAIKIRKVRFIKNQERFIQILFFKNVLGYNGKIGLCFSIALTTAIKIRERRFC